MARYLRFSLRSLFVLQLLCCLPLAVVQECWYQECAQAPGLVLRPRYGWPAPLVGIIYHPSARRTNIGGYADDGRCLWLVEKGRVIVNKRSD